MKEGFRQSMTWLHTWGGLLTGWVLFFVFLTGTAGYVDAELDRWMRPEKPLMAPQVAQADALDRGLAWLEAEMPTAARWFVIPPGNREQADLRAFAEAYPKKEGARGQRVSAYLNPETGVPVVYRETGGGRLLYRMHYQLHYMPKLAGEWIVGFCTMVMFAAIVTGVIIHARIFKDFFTFRPGNGQRAWLDAHNLLGVLALPFHLMITYSGLLFLCYVYMAPVIATDYGWERKEIRTFVEGMFNSGPHEIPERAGRAVPLVPLAPLVAEAERRWGEGGVRQMEVRHPGDANARVIFYLGERIPDRARQRMVFDGTTGAVLDDGRQDRPVPQAVAQTFLSLHEGLFAGPVLRWLYFLAGLAGTAMIASGLVLWTRKRQARLRGARGFALVERLNLATICGLPVGIAAYLWANRLLPLDMTGRAAAEADALFLAWAVLALHAGLRPAARAWAEQCWVAAAAFGLIPLLNALTTERHLGASLPAGQWELAAIDLGCLAFGAGFALVAWRLPRRRPVSLPARAVGEAAE